MRKSARLQICSSHMDVFPGPHSLLSGNSVPLQAVNTSKKGNEALGTGMFKSLLRFISQWLVQSY